MKNSRRLITILMAIMLIVTFSLGSISNATTMDINTETETTYDDIEVGESNGMEYRTIKDLDLREGNSDSYDSIIEMPKGSYVKHLGTTDNGWFKLDYKGVVGYAPRTSVTSKANYDKNYGDIIVSGSNGLEYRTTKGLYLRAGNSDSYDSIAEMPKGSYVKHVGTTDNGWFKLDYKGTIGYAPRTSVTSKANYDKNYDDIKVSKPNGLEYRTTRDVYLRNGNLDSYDSIIEMPKGSYVKHVGTTDNNWFKLDYNGIIGYASRTSVTAKDSYDKNYDNIIVSKPNGKKYVTIMDLDLRNGDSDSHGSITKMPKGSYVRHLGTTDNNWFKLDYNGMIGYAHRSHVTAPPKPMVFLDYGHGGRDPGAGAFGRREKDDVLRLGLLVARNLRNKGVIVDESRANDKTVTLQDRPKIANQKDYNYFVSIHRNSNSGPRPGIGVETFSHAQGSQKSKDLSSLVQKNLVRVGFHNRGAKHMNLHVLRETKAPAILIEVGFINNPIDNLIFDTKLNQIAKAISDGVLSELARN